MKHIKIRILFLLLAFIVSGSFSYSDELPPEPEETSQAYNQEPLKPPSCNQFTFDASQSYDPDNQNLLFFWDFGDGSTSNESIIKHIYDKTGDYTVVLTVTDNSGMECSTATRKNVVHVNIPPKASFIGPEQACVNQKLDFDAAGSYDNNKGKMNYEWNFGDGTKMNGVRVAKMYPSGGDFKISMKIDDSSGSACSSSVAEKTIHVNEAPVAKAGQEVILKCVETPEDLVVKFDASKSIDGNNDPLIYTWDFGDGTSGNDMQMAHHYARVGNYDVKLIVKDNSLLSCNASADFITLRLNDAPRSDAGNDTTSCVGDQVNFDGSSSYVNTKGTANYSWTFGDGETGEGIKVIHAYRESGKYLASLTVEDKLNSMCHPSKDSRNVIVNAPPAVSLTTSSSACIGDIVSYEAAAHDPDNDPLEYYWSFGDGSILRSGSKVTHEYEHGGSYKVTVIVDDGKSSSCSTATANAIVKVNSPPVADAGANLACCTNIATSFNGSASSDPDRNNLSYTWDFGDGTKAKGMVVTHVYNQSSVYNVVLTVDDGSGTSCSQSTAGFEANVNATPVPVMTIR